MKLSSRFVQEPIEQGYKEKNNEKAIPIKDNEKLWILICSMVIASPNSARNKLMWSILVLLSSPLNL